jgi:hypothetical protein
MCGGYTSTSTEPELSLSLSLSLASSPSRGAGVSLVNWLCLWCLPLHSVQCCAPTVPSGCAVARPLLCVAEVACVHPCPHPRGAQAPALPALPPLAIGFVQRHYSSCRSSGRALEPVAQTLAPQHRAIINGPPESQVCGACACATDSR